jgi:hypothetical protein
MSYIVRHGRLEIEVTSAQLHVRNRQHVGKILATEVTRPGMPGYWNYHATKGWRRVRKSP